MVNWVLTDLQMTGTIVTPTGSWSCICYHQSPNLSRYGLGEPHSQWGAPVHNRTLLEMGHVPEGMAFSLKYPRRLIFWRYVSHLQSNNHCQAQSQVQKRAFARHLLIGMNPFCSCPVHTCHVLSRFYFLAKRWWRLQVVYRPKSMPQAPSFWEVSMLAV
jgi:hypothetical protein